MNSKKKKKVNSPITLASFFNLGIVMTGLSAVIIFKGYAIVQVSSETS